MIKFILIFVSGIFSCSLFAAGGFTQPTYETVTFSSAANANSWVTSNNAGFLFMGSCVKYSPGPGDYCYGVATKGGSSTVQYDLVIACGGGNYYDTSYNVCRPDGQTDCQFKAGTTTSPFRAFSGGWSICDGYGLECVTGDYKTPPASHFKDCGGDLCEMLVDVDSFTTGTCSAESGATKKTPKPIYCTYGRAGYTGSSCNLRTEVAPSNGLTGSGTRWDYNDSPPPTGSGSGGSGAGAGSDSGSGTGSGSTTGSGSPTGGTGGSTGGSGSGTGSGTGDGTGSGSGAGGSGTGTGTGTGDGKGDGSGYGNSKCSDPFVCTGDPVQCGIAREVWQARCVTEKINTLDGVDSTAFDPFNPFGDSEFKQKSNDALNKNGIFDFDILKEFEKNRQEYFSFASSCVSSIPVEFGYISKTIDVSFLCELGRFIRLIMHMAAYLIVVRLIHRTLS